MLGLSQKEAYGRGGDLIWYNSSMNGSFSIHHTLLILLTLPNRYENHQGVIKKDSYVSRRACLVHSFAYPVYQTPDGADWQLPQPMKCSSSCGSRSRAFFWLKELSIKMQRPWVSLYCRCAIIIIISLTEQWMISCWKTRYSPIPVHLLYFTSPRKSFGIRLCTMENIKIGL